MNINYQKVKSSKEAFQIVKTSITPDSLKKYNVLAEFTYDEAKPRIVAEGKGFTLTMDFYDDSLTMDLDLSFMLKAFRGKIEDLLSNELKKKV
jgi:hypothetical protein